MQSASIPLHQHFTRSWDMDLCDLLLNRWPNRKKESSSRCNGHLTLLPRDPSSIYAEKELCKEFPIIFITRVGRAVWYGKLIRLRELVRRDGFLILTHFFFLWETQRNNNISVLLFLPSVRSPLLRLNPPVTFSLMFVFDVSAISSGLALNRQGRHWRMRSRSS